MTDDLESDPPAPEGTAAPESSGAPTGLVAPAVPRRRLGIVAAVAATVVIVDQLSKWWVVNRLTNGQIIDLIGSLRLNLYFNTGVAFSLGSGNGLGPWISVLAIGVVVAVSFGATSRFPLGAVASGLISGGALGNLLDRAFRGDAGFLHGAVIDWIDLQWWPVFNVADASIVIGAILLVFASFRVSQ